MVGYSRLMQADEIGTVARQRACMDDLVLPAIKEFRGRLVKTTGDGALVEFASAIDAVMCAVAVQRAMPAREADEPEDRRITYRIGINLGEVIDEEGDIFGDGVNVAARLESLAEPGGICISDTIYNTIKGKLDLGFADHGAQHLKNITDPVQSYSVLMDHADAGKLVSAVRPRFLTRALVVGLAVLVLVFGVYYALNKPSGLPDVAQKRLLVLPYASQNPDADIYAEAVSENLWLTLGRVKGMTIVPRRVALEMKGVQPTAAQLTEFGGVTHILDGSVAASSGKMTVSSRLRRVSGEAEQVMWEQESSADGSLIFQSLARQKSDLISELNIALNAREREILKAAPTQNPEAYLLFAHGEALQASGGNNDLGPAIRLFDQAIDLDPKFVDAKSSYASANFTAWNNGWNNVRDNRDALRDTKATIEDLLRGDSNHPTALGLRAAIAAARVKREEALNLARSAVFLNTQAPGPRRTLAYALLVNGLYEEARTELQKFIDLSPRLNFEEQKAVLWYYLRLNDLDAAGKVLQEFEAANQADFGLSFSRAAYLARTGRVEEARAVVDQIRTAVPFLSLMWMELQYRKYKDPAIFETYSEAMLAAGLPQKPYNFDKGHEADRMDEAALRELLTDGIRAVNGTDPLGAPFALEIRTDGTMELDFTSFPTDPFQGVWEIDGDEVCFTVPGIVVGHRYCDWFYRDSARWSDETPRYIQLNAFGPFRFAVESLED